MSKPTFIAEIKMKSPFGFKRTDLDVWDMRELAVEHGDMVAAHTEARFGSTQYEFERAAEQAHWAGKEIIAKGIHPTDESIDKSRSWGADWVLVVGRIPDNEHMRHCCIYEPASYEEFLEVPHKGRWRIMWNARDLTTGNPKPDYLADVRSKTRGWLCQASYIQHPEDVRPDVDAFIVGEHLPQFIEEWNAN